MVPLPRSRGHPCYSNRNRRQTMPSLTVTEKEHWKERIGRRLDKKIEVLCASDPGLMDRIQEQASQRAVASLGLADMQAELDAIDKQKQDLENREWHAHCAMLAA